MMTKIRKKAAMLILIAILLPSLQVQAATSRFFVDWSGDIWGNSAQAHGILSVNDALFLASSDDAWLIPGEEVTDFALTVSGARSGNGSFQLSDFAGFVWSSRGSLDLSRELIGQTTTGGPWGSDFGAEALAGDFNLIPVEDSTAPFAYGAFILITDSGEDNLGAGDRLNLVSFRPVPVPAAIWLFGSALVGVLGLGRKRRH